MKRTTDRPQKGARKITVVDQEWWWMHSSKGAVIWDPEGKKHIATIESVQMDRNKYAVTPHMVVDHIKKRILKTKPLYKSASTEQKETIGLDPTVATAKCRECGNNGVVDWVENNGIDEFYYAADKYVRCSKCGTNNVAPVDRQIAPPDAPGNPFPKLSPEEERELRGKVSVFSGPESAGPAITYVRRLLTTLDSERAANGYDPLSVGSRFIRQLRSGPYVDGRDYACAKALASFLEDALIAPYDYDNAYEETGDPSKDKEALATWLWDQAHEPAYCSPPWERNFSEAMSMVVRHRLDVSAVNDETARALAFEHTKNLRREEAQQ